jgi:hypothetical protein
MRILSIIFSRSITTYCENTVRDIAEAIKKETGLQATDYRLTHEGRNLPGNNNNREKIGHRITQGDTVQIRITGKGGADRKRDREGEEEDSDGESALEARMKQRRKDSKDKRKKLQPIGETVRNNSNSVPCMKTWDTGDRQGYERTAALARNYLKLFEIRHVEGTPAAEEQIRQGEHHDKVLIKPTIATRGTKPTITHHSNGTLFAQNLDHWDTHVYKAYAEFTRERPGQEDTITKRECYDKARENIHIYKATLTKNKRVSTEAHKEKRKGKQPHTQGRQEKKQRREEPEQTKQGEKQTEEQQQGQQ